MIRPSIFQGLLKHNFPQIPLCIAYGSGVIKQRGYEDYEYSSSSLKPSKNDTTSSNLDSSSSSLQSSSSSSSQSSNSSEKISQNGAKRAMIDMIFVVDNSSKWHSQNMKQNPQHYSTILRWLGQNLITKIQRNFGAKIYYHPFVHLSASPQYQGIENSASGKELVDDFVQNREYKYGVIEAEDFIEDMNHWTTLYCSGRLQKPVLLVFPNNHQDQPFEINNAQVSSKEESLYDSVSGKEEMDFHLNHIEIQPLYKDLKDCYYFNLSKAFDCARLLLPETFNELDLYRKICSISYMGDIRTKVIVGENANKVDNIVAANFSQFRELYQPFWSKLKRKEKSNNVTYKSILEGQQQQHEEIMIFCQDKANISEKIELMSHLPSFLLQTMRKNYFSEIAGSKNEQENNLSWISNIVNEGREQEFLQKALCQIISSSSTSQSLKGLITAGFYRSMIYVWEKLKKGIKSKL